MDKLKGIPTASEGFVLDYEGPFCFYKYLKHRQKKCPLFLDRNIRKGDGLRRKRSPQRTMTLEFSETIRGALLCVHVTRTSQTQLTLQSSVQIVPANDKKVCVGLDTYLHSVPGSRQMSALLLLVVLPTNEPSLYSAAGLQPGHTATLSQFLQLIASDSPDRSLPWRLVEFITWSVAVDGTNPPMSVANGERAITAQMTASASTETPKRSAKKRRHESTTTRELVWPTVLIGGRQRIDMRVQREGSDDATISHSRTPDKSRERELTIVATSWTNFEQATAGKRKADFDKLYMHYLFKNPGSEEFRSFVEMHRSITCGWCGVARNSPQALIQHLRCSHTHFNYEVTTDQQRNLHIVVRRCADSNTTEQELNTERYASLCFASESRYGTNGTPVSELAVEQIPCIMVAQRGDNARYYEPGELRVVPVRQNYHVRFGIPTAPTEYDYASDDDVDRSWELLLSEKLIDEFEDVSKEEKEFMKLWNRHVNTTIVVADAQVADSCELFARRFAPILIEEKLRHNFLLHLITLWDFSLLTGPDIIRCMAVIDSAATNTKR